MKKVIYIHGFASNGESEKAQILRNHFGAGNVISPSLPTAPHDAMKILETIIEKENHQVFLIGTSLGGFYGCYLCQRFNVCGILINPLINIEQIATKIGIQTNYATGETFEFKSEYVQHLLDYKKTISTINNHHIHLFLGMNDEVLNPSDAENDPIFRFVNKYHFNDNHRFATFEQHLNLVETLMKESE